MSSALVDEIIDSMKKSADPAHAITTAHYVKTTALTFLGLRVSQIDTIAHKYIGDLPEEELPPVMNRLWKTGMYEGRLAAVSTMKRYATTGDIDSTLPVISRWIDDIDTWAILDPLAIYCVGKLLLRDSEVETTLAEWGLSTRFWRRRASILPHILLCRKQFYKEEYGPRILASLRPHLPDHEFFVKKAVGWLLRELGQRDPEGVASFVAENRDMMARLTVREAERKLKPLDTR